MLSFNAMRSIEDLASALTVSAVCAGLLVLLGMGLAIRVMRLRREQRIGLGDGNDVNMLKRIRSHGNFVEQAVFGLPLLILMPLAAVPAGYITLLGLMLLVGRIAHPIGINTSTGVTVGRVLGMVLSWLALILMVIAVITGALGTGTAVMLFKAP